MQPLKKRASDLLKQIRSAYETLHIDAKAEELAAIDRQLADRMYGRMLNVRSSYRANRQRYAPKLSRGRYCVRKQTILLN